MLEDKLVYPIMKKLLRVFIENFESKYKGQGMTEFQLVFLHRKIFNVVSNFHSLFCRGDKTFEDAV